MTFLIGGDISLLTKMEELGQVYTDADGPADFLTLVKRHGWNFLRLRLWVDPSGDDLFVNDLAYTVALGKRIKEAGFQLLLDFHYSDSWADPGQQTKPAAWAELPFDTLADQVELYSLEVITEMRRGGAMPDMVQIGNEITPGMLWPDGQIYGGTKPNTGGFPAFAALVRAGIAGTLAGAGDDRPRIMIHIDRGGDWAGTRTFFDALAAEGVDYDVMGLSFYPFFHGPLPLLEETLQQAALRYHKPIVVVETGYPYGGSSDHADWIPSGLTYPMTPDGQREFLADLVAAIHRVPENLGIGVNYWAPEWLKIDGLRSSWHWKTLFDQNGHALPGLSFGPPS